MAADGGFSRASSLHMTSIVMRVSRLVLLLFITAQIFDGLFTYVAVSAVGLHAEGNALLQTWMALAGPGPTLVVAKLVAAAGGVLVYYHGMHRLLAGLTALYALAAIGPWLAVFHAWP
jgi:hypothetical protein